MTRLAYARGFAGPSIDASPVTESSTAVSDVAASRIRIVTLVALGALAMLNIADVATTHMLLAHRAIEANPLAQLLLSSQNILWVKLCIVALLIARVARSRGRLGTMAATCFAAGIYATAVLSNLLVLHAAGGV